MRHETRQNVSDATATDNSNSNNNSRIKDSGYHYVYRQ